MSRLFFALNNVVLGGYSPGGATTYVTGEDQDIVSTFASLFTSAFNLIADNPALFGILCVAVGAPILATVLAIFKK